MDVHKDEGRRGRVYFVGVCGALIFRHVERCIWGGLLTSQPPFQAPAWDGGYA